VPTSTEPDKERYFRLIDELVNGTVLAIVAVIFLLRGRISTKNFPPRR